MKLNAMTKKVQNINITDLTAIYSNFEASMATQCILDQLRDHERCEYDYVASTITLTTQRRGAGGRYVFNIFTVFTLFMKHFSLLFLFLFSFIFVHFYLTFIIHLLFNLTLLSS